MNKGDEMEFNRTKKAALAEKTSKWDLIAAIAEDAVEAKIPITGAESQLAAREAFEGAGNEHSDRIVFEFCILAKYDHEASLDQRTVLRSYGWSTVTHFVRNGFSQEAAVAYLSADRRTRREALAFIQSQVRCAGTPRCEKITPIDDEWRQWLNRANRLLIDGANLAERSEQEAAELGVYSASARLIYERITERKIDAEIRQFLESAVDAQ